MSAGKVRDRVDAIIDQYDDNTGRLLNTLNDVQEEFRYLPSEALDHISKRMEVPVAQLERMGEFFGNLSLDPVGAYLIDVCDGTACHTQGSSRLVQEFEKKLGIKAGETTDDGMITLRTVGCVGACGMAPVVVACDDAYGRVRIAQVAGIAHDAPKGKQGESNPMSEERARRSGDAR